eukprot:1145119-Pelagomonas_calceolata.AAC.2
MSGRCHGRSASCMRPQNLRRRSCTKGGCQGSAQGCRQGRRIHNEELGKSVSMSNDMPSVHPLFKAIQGGGQLCLRGTFGAMRNFEWHIWQEKSLHDPWHAYAAVCSGGTGSASGHCAGSMPCLSLCALFQQCPNVYAFSLSPEAQIGCEQPATKKDVTQLKAAYCLQHHRAESTHKHKLPTPPACTRREGSTTDEA